MFAALLTPIFMGLAPVFGKLAIWSGLDAYTLAALRTCLAAALLWIVYLIFFRKFTYIFPAGLLGTFVVGTINGLGSLLFYNGLLLLDDASLVQLLNMTYVIFAILLTRLNGSPISRMSIFRAILALIAVYLLSTGGESSGSIHWIGVGLMLGGAFMYALHVVLSQRVMFEMPAPTMALYALTFMGLTVLIARLVVGNFAVGLSWSPVRASGWWFILGLTAVTALSRVTLFAGVRNLGGLQTILLNMAEIGVTLLAAAIWLDERLTVIQWVGVAVMMLSVVLSRWDTRVSEVYRRMPRPTVVGLPLGFSRRPIEPGPFSTVSQMYRRPPSATPQEPDLSQFGDLANMDLDELARLAEESERDR
jgi:drug/metabolite transporter (DMT)-like permease